MFVFFVTFFFCQRLTLKRREEYEKYKVDVKNYMDNLTPLQIKHKETLSMLTNAKKVNKVCIMCSQKLNLTCNEIC